MLAGNHVMISNGCGITSVPIELQPAFTGLLIQFYESNDMTEIKQFLYENCINGIEFTPLSEQETERVRTCRDGGDKTEQRKDFRGSIVGNRGTSAPCPLNDYELRLTNWEVWMMSERMVKKPAV